MSEKISSASLGFERDAELRQKIGLLIYLKTAKACSRATIGPATCKICSSDESSAFAGAAPLAPKSALGNASTRQIGLPEKELHARQYVDFFHARRSRGRPVVNGSPNGPL
jgi:hypothetical protein